MNGLTMIAGASQSALASLTDAYEAALRDLEERADADRGVGGEESPFIRDTKAVITYRRKQLNERIEELEKIKLQCDNLTQGTRAKLQQLLAAANNDLKIRAEAGLVTAVGSQWERIRQAKQAERGSEFLKYLRATLPAPDYLRHWTQHCQLMSHLCLGGSGAATSTRAAKQLSQLSEIDDVPVSRHPASPSCLNSTAVGQTGRMDLDPIQRHHQIESIQQRVDILITPIEWVFHSYSGSHLYVAASPSFTCGCGHRGRHRDQRGLKCLLIIGGEDLLILLRRTGTNDARVWNNYLRRARSLIRLGGPRRHLRLGLSLRFSFGFRLRFRLWLRFCFTLGPRSGMRQFAVR